MENLSRNTDDNQIQLNSINEFQQNSTDINRNQLISTEINKNQLISTDINRFQPILMSVMGDQQEDD